MRGHGVTCVPRLEPDQPPLMKIRHPALIRSVTWVGGWAARGWLRTLRYRYQSAGPDLDPNGAALPGHFIYAMWHEYLLLPIFRYARPDIHVLISQHTDGQIVADVCRHLGIPVVRGSTTRGGADALRQLVRAGQLTHLALTPDGPRGPRRQVKPGVIYLGARTGLPIVPVGFGFRRCWRAKSWDRFALPWPWTQAACVTGEPILVPADAETDELEQYRVHVETALEQATLAAEAWAQTSVPPAAPPSAARDVLPQS